MQTFEFIRRASAVALVSLCAGCATWQEMDRSEKGTAVGATGGALAGAAIGGPVGAVVGAGVGGYAGHHQGFGDSDRNAQARASRSVSPAPITRSGDYASSPDLVRSVQRSLNDKGFDAGPADGQWGPSTESALREFQESNGLAQTGNLDRRTMNALGVAR
jgi:hypothetical protein